MKKKRRLFKCAEPDYDRIVMWNPEIFEEVAIKRTRNVTPTYCPDGRVTDEENKFWDDRNSRAEKVFKETKQQDQFNREYGSTCKGGYTEDERMKDDIDEIRDALYNEEFIEPTSDPIVAMAYAEEIFREKQIGGEMSFSEQSNTENIQRHKGVDEMPNNGPFASW